MTNSAADVSEGQENAVNNRPRQSGVERRMFGSVGNKNLRESREGSEVRQGIAGCSPASMEGVSGEAAICLERYRRNTNDERFFSNAGSVLDDLSVLHVDNAVGLGREFIVMRDDHERRAACLA